MRRSLLAFALAALLTTPAGAQITPYPAGPTNQSSLALIAPTPPTAANNNQIATTAWVNNLVNAGLPLASGKIWIGSVGNIATAQTPSGDCTFSVLGVVTCTQAAGNFQVIGNLTVGGSIIDGNGILATNIAAPATPAAGTTRIYVDSTTKTLSAKNDAGTVSNTVVASSAVANQFLTGIGAAGVITRAQPAVTDLSGFGAGCGTFLGTPSSANLRGCITDETGTGPAVFGTSPNITTPTGIVKGDVGLGNVNNVAQIATVKKQVFTVTGTYTPSTGMVYAIVECVGGGAGGGGAVVTAAVGQYSGGGGGAGGYSKIVVTAATIGASKAVAIGAGGAGGAAGANSGVDGADTTLGTTICVGKGGTKGIFASVASFGAGGAGGVAGTGDLAAGGGSGGTGVYSANSPATVAYLTSGAGGASVFGSGGIAVQNGTGVGGSTNGASGVGFGGGGSGGISQQQSSGTTSASGGAGSNGVIFITEFCTQ